MSSTHSQFRIVTLLNHAALNWRMHPSKLTGFETFAVPLTDIHPGHTMLPLNVPPRCMKAVYSASMLPSDVVRSESNAWMLPNFDEFTMFTEWQLRRTSFLPLLSIG